MASQQQVSASTTTTTKNNLFHGLVRREAVASSRPEPESSKGRLGLTTLYEPEQTIVADLIFVHGLNGGSYRTWTKKGEKSLYWPGEWLPQDEAFKDVRIHTYGYSAEVSRDSLLNFQDVARGLLAAIKDSPVMGRRPTDRLIFIGHSMGGLVIKSAIILGREISEYKDLVARCGGIFFLATPHQGSELARTLSRVIALVPFSGARPFVGDLLPRSALLEEINESFPRVSSDLQLFSFYETRVSNFKVGKGMIVEKHSAVMNLPNERRTPLEANHSSVASFASVYDPSYIAVRNSLVQFIQGQRDSAQLHRRELDEERQARLGAFLGAHDGIEDSIKSLDALRWPGSCEWFLKKDSFQSWKAGTGSRMLWVRGRPGAGKSVLSGHIVNSLRNAGFACCCYFFREDDDLKSSANAFLRSIAWQMSLNDSDIGQEILDLAQGEHNVSTDRFNHNSIWRRVFASGILKVKLSRPVYWIVDAMDECKDAADVFGFLVRAQEYWPLSIIMTSRGPYQSVLSGSTAVVDVRTEPITEEDTSGDITQFLRANVRVLPWTPSDIWQTPDDMVSYIAQKANGCFLWASLVFAELQQVHTSREAMDVLESSKGKLDEVYSKILTNMSSASHGKDIAKSMLVWATYAFRPLSTTEARVCLEMDLKGTVDDLENAIAACCGDFVYVDKKRNIQLAHLTVKEYLTRNDIETEFMESRTTAHPRIAMTCIRYLIETNERQSKMRLRGAQVQQPIAVLQEYATKYVFEHVHLMESCHEKELQMLAKFLKSTALLYWIEFNAKASELHRVVRAGNILRSLLSRRSQKSPSIALLSPSVQKDLGVLEKWAADLPYLTSRFSRWLGLCPFSIHHLIPPFAPPASAVRQQFTSKFRGLLVNGLSQTGWDECLTTITYDQNTRPTTIASGAGYFAIGTMKGTVLVYSDEIFQEIHVLNHQEPVWKLTLSHHGTYGDRSALLASAGGKSIRTFRLDTGVELYRLDIRGRCLALSFMNDNQTLRAVTARNKLLEWDVETGTLIDDLDEWTSDSEVEALDLQFKAPQLAAIGPNSHLACMVYRGEDLVLWDYDGELLHDVYEKETGSRRYESAKTAPGSTAVTAIAFGETLDSHFLAASYYDGDLAVYDTSDGSVAAIAQGVNATVMVASPDGRTLATADSNGNMKLFDFKTLRCLARIRLIDNIICPKSLAFTADSRRLIEVRGNQCRIWEPTALLRYDGTSLHDTEVESGPEELDHQMVERVAITAMECIKAPPMVLCGKRDGSIHVYDLSGNETASAQLFVQTPGCPVHCIHFDDVAGLLYVADRSGKVTGRQLFRQKVRQTVTWKVNEPLFTQMSSSIVTQLLGSAKHSRLLISSEDFETLWPLPEPADCVFITQWPVSERSRWMQHPTMDDRALGIGKASINVYSWQVLQCLQTVNLDLGPRIATIDNVIQLQGSPMPDSFITVSEDIAGSQRSVHVWDSKPRAGEENDTAPSHVFNSALPNMEVLVGCFGARLVFLTRDYWVCSVALGAMEGPEDVTRHFMIPPEWASVNHRPMMATGQNGEVIFMKENELAVIKRGLEYTERGEPFNPRGTIVQ